MYSFISSYINYNDLIMTYITIFLANIETAFMEIYQFK